MESGGRLPSNHRQKGAQSNAHNFFFLHGVRCIMWVTWFSFPISPLISDCLALLDTNHDLRGNRWVTSRDGREKKLGSFTLVKSYTTKFTPLFRECRQILFFFLWYSTIFSFLFLPFHPWWWSTFIAIPDANRCQSIRMPISTLQET